MCCVLNIIRRKVRISPVDSETSDEIIRAQVRNYFYIKMYKLYLDKALIDTRLL